MDAADLEAVAGTIAGDDTIFIATVSNETAAKLARDLNALASGMADLA